MHGLDWMGKEMKCLGFGFGGVVFSAEGEGVKRMIVVGGGKVVNSLPAF